jgi:hypothetical protein
MIPALWVILASLNPAISLTGGCSCRRRCRRRVIFVAIAAIAKGCAAAIFAVSFVHRYSFSVDNLPWSMAGVFVAAAAAAAAGRFCCRRVAATFACNYDCDALNHLQNTLPFVPTTYCDTSIAQVFCSMGDICPDIWLFFGEWVDRLWGIGGGLLRLYLHQLKREMQVNRPISLKKDQQRWKMWSLVSKMSHVKKYV